MLGKQKPLLLPPMARTTAHKKMFERVVLVLCNRFHAFDMTLDAPKINY